ncbi:MAG: galactose mutarotase [Verrucomicrobia bacterium]|nr:galactose mutarotase [Verrucomicrobiota bacterium]
MKSTSNKFAAFIALTLVFCFFRGTSSPAADAPRVRELRVDAAEFGKLPDGKTVEVYTLRNANGLAARVMTFGATLIGVETPDRDGKFDNITLYLDTFAEYFTGHPVLGSTIGRYANRIANAKFSIDGTEYKVTANARPHHIHGGANGFHKLLWSARAVRYADSVAVELTLTSPDGDEGYPGTLKAKVVYRLTDKDELFLEYTATTDKPTVVNLTNHTYWNLGGAGSGDVLAEKLTIPAAQYLPADDLKIPSGKIEPVARTPLDFTKPHEIGERIKEVSGGGYDHCYVLTLLPNGSLRPAARVEDPRTGRVMEILTTEPGVQLYTANGLSDKLKGGGKPYGKYHAVCLETQKFPDSPNHANFPTALLKPGETFRSVTVHKFSVAK